MAYWHELKTSLPLCLAIRNIQQMSQCCEGSDDAMRSDIKLPTLLSNKTGRGWNQLLQQETHVSRERREQETRYSLAIMSIMCACAGNSVSACSIESNFIWLFSFLLFCFQGARLSCALFYVPSSSPGFFEVFLWTLLLVACYKATSFVFSSSVESIYLKKAKDNMFWQV